MYFDPSLEDFDLELEDVEVRKTKKFDRIFRIGFGGSIDQKPALVNGVIYFGALDYNIYAVDADTGKEVWRFRTNGPIMESSPVIFENVMYIGSFDFNLYALNIKNGEEIWKFRTGGEILGCAAVEGDFVYFGSRDGFVYCLRRKDASLVWRFRTGDWVASSPIVHRGKVYIGSYDGNYYCLDAGTGVRYMTSMQVRSTEGWFSFLHLTTTFMLLMQRWGKNYGGSGQANTGWPQLHT
jgi:outer membrane protein assembly factor BamB